MRQQVVKLRLRLSAEQRQALRATQAQFAACFNAVADYGWRQGVRNGVALHHATYYTLRQAHPQLPAQLVIAARMKATEALRATHTRLRQGRRASCPTARPTGAMRYDARSYAFWPDRREVSLASVAGRLRCAVRVPAYFQARLAAALGFDSADLVADRRGGFWLHLTITLPAPAPPAESGAGEPWAAEAGAVVGVDLGLRRLAVSANGRKAQFFCGKRVRERARRYHRLRRALQAKGTRSARRHLRKLRGRENRFRRDVNHQVSKALVAALPAGSLIALEQLEGLRERVRQRRAETAARRELHNWGFAQLQGFVAYKAQAQGLRVLWVDAAYSSQQCSRCGHTAAANRRSPSWFVCHACGLQLNADLNAARNLAQRARGALSGPTVNRPNVPGSAPASAHVAAPLARG
jgi:IS605 OrfB family transposase